MSVSRPQLTSLVRFAERVCLQRDALIKERTEAVSILGGRYNVNMVRLTSRVHTRLALQLIEESSACAATLYWFISTFLLTAP